MRAAMLLAMIAATGCRTTPTTVVSSPAPATPTTPAAPDAPATPILTPRVVWTPPIDAAFAEDADRMEIDMWHGATTLYRARTYDQAAEAFRRFTLSFGDSDRLPLAVFMHAHCLRLGGHPLEAKKMYKVVVDYFPGDNDLSGAALFYIAWCHATLGETAPAAEAYLRFTKDPRFAFHPLSAAARQHLEDLDPSLQNPAEHPIVTDNFAEATQHAKAGELEAAYAIYREVAAFFPDHGMEATWRLGQLAEAHGDTTRAIAAYRLGDHRYHDPRAAEALARLGRDLP